MHSTYFVNHCGNVIMQLMTAGKVCNKVVHEHIRANANDCHGNEYANTRGSYA